MARQSWPVLALQVVLGAIEGTKGATGEVDPARWFTEAGEGLDPKTLPLVTYVDSWEGERAARGGLTGT